jgi:FkbM family methyltransferase
LSLANWVRHDSAIIRALGPNAGALYIWQRWRRRFFPHRRPYRLFSRDSRHALWCRPGTSDLDVFTQVFLEREYSALNGGPEPGLILDLGANVGYTTAYFLSRFPRARLLAVEPDAGNFALLQRNVAPYEPRAKLLRAAIWSRSVPLVLSEAPYRDSREWSRQVRECRPGEIPEFPGIEMKDLLRDSGESRISILKLDVEGAEREVFTASDLTWLNRVDRIAVELHDEFCEQAFFQAIAPHPFRISKRGELVLAFR